MLEQFFIKSCLNDDLSWFKQLSIYIYIYIGVFEQIFIRSCLNDKLSCD